jgi:hypothetical protein
MVRTEQVLPGTPVRDALGQWHADVTLPIPAVSGVWSPYRWQSTGSSASQSALQEGRFYLNSLEY